MQKTGITIDDKIKERNEEIKKNWSYEGTTQFHFANKIKVYFPHSWKIDEIPE